MVAFKVEQFGGQIPIIDDRLLPPQNAAYTQDAFLQSGRLEPLAADIDIWTLADPNARYAFRVPKADPGINNLTESFWLEFEDANTSVVRSPVTDTVEGGRYYWANGDAPPGYTTRGRLETGDPALVLGIPRPEIAPTVVVAGGVGPTLTRAYVYTWVSTYGEEGPPSPPTVETGNIDGTWTIGLTVPTIVDTTGRALTHSRIYRTESDADGNVDYFFVVELPIATLTFDDTISGDIVANSGILASETWTGPPADLKGMVSMPNGMVVGWRANEIWFCEPYRLHAWPVEYVLGVESPIVGLGTIQQNCMVLTNGQPYVCFGIHPSIMALTKVQPLEPCTSQGSIVQSPQGVLYTSYNGLIAITPNGGNNLTFNMIRKDDWEKFLNLGTIHASYFMDAYYTYSGVADGVFQADAFQNDAFQMEDFTSTTKGAHISLGDARLGFMTLTSATPTYNVMTDLWTGETFVIRNGKVYHVDRRVPDPRQSYVWRSKIVQTNYKDNFAAAKIYYDLPPGSPPSVNTYFRLYADDRLKFQRTLPPSGVQFRLPSGYKADSVQFELEGQLMVFNLQVATSARELREV